MLFKALVTGSLFMTFSFYAYCQTPELINLHGQAPHSKILYLGVTNSFKVTGLKKGAKIESNGIAWKMKSDTLTLLPEKAGPAQLFIGSQDRIYTFTFQAKRLANPLAAH